MEIKTAEEFRKMKLHGKGSSSPVYNAIMGLQIDQALEIKKTEWKHSYPPTRLVNYIEKKYAMRFERGAHADRSGWMILRVR